MTKIASFTTALLLFISNSSLAGESIESFWLGKLPKVIEQIPAIDSPNITIKAWGDSALFIFENETEVAKSLCHFHSSNDYYHCSLEAADFTLPEKYRTILEMSAQNFSELLQSMGLEVSTNDQVWPWVVGAIAVYYVSKKAINYWVNKSFKAKPHSHEFSLLDASELETATAAQLEMIQAHTQDLDEIFNTETKLNFLEREKVRTMLQTRIRGLNKKILDELVGSYCSTCKTVHAPQESHEHFFAVTPQSTGLIQSTLSQTPSYTAQMRAQLETPTADEAKEASDPKSLVEKSVVLKTAKALLVDIHKELIQPIPKAFKAVRRFVSKKENFSQLNSYAQTKYNTSIGESNISTGIAIASSLITVKVLGETLESMVVGPYHIFCQLSDVAAVTTGLVFLTTYHSLRQPIKLRRPQLLFTKKFWSLMFEKLKNPTLNGRIAASKEDKDFPASESLILELSKLKNQIQQLIWQLRSSKSLTSKQANALARKLGKISKKKEDIIFSVKINDLYSASELLTLVEGLKPVYQGYRGLFEEIGVESEKTQNLPSMSVNSCAGFL